KTAVVGVVHVTDFNAGTVTRKTARAQGRKTALVGQLGQGVVLVHELGQRAGADELPDGRDDGPDVDKALRCDFTGFLVLQGHALAHNALHAGEADAELVLQQFTDAAHPAVAKVVDLVGGADAVVKAEEVADRSEDIVNGDGAADQRVTVAAQKLLLFLRVRGGVKDLADFSKGGALIDAAFFHIKAEERLGVNAAVRNDDHRGRFLVLALHQNGDAGDAGAVDLLRLFGRDLFALGGEQFAGQRGDDVLSRAVAGNAAGQRELFVHLEPAEPGKIVAARIKEEGVDMAAGVFNRRRFAGAQLAVAFKQAFLGIVGDVLLNRGDD